MRASILSLSFSADRRLTSAPGRSQGSTRRIAARHRDHAHTSPDGRHTVGVDAPPVVACAQLRWRGHSCQRSNSQEELLQSSHHLVNLARITRITPHAIRTGNLANRHRTRQKRVTVPPLEVPSWRTRVPVLSADTAGAADDATLEG